MRSKLLLLVVSLLFAACADTSIRPSANYEMAAALIRHELSSSDSYMGANKEFPFFVSVEGDDLPSDFIARLSDTGMAFFAGSTWAEGKGMKMQIGAPKQRSDGNYDVSHSYYCGVLCASSNTAIMRHDQSGWHVLSSDMHWIS